MKKILLIFLFSLGILFISIFCFSFSSFHEKTNDFSFSSIDHQAVFLRAGGGSSSGGGHSSSGSGSHGGGYHSSGGRSSLFSNILFYIVFFFGFFFTSIYFYFHLVRASMNSRKFLKMLSLKDKTWNYKKQEKQVIEAFYSIQNSWTNGDMSNSKDYMDCSLYEEFQTKLVWMEMRKERNVLKRIRLLDIKPVFVHDEEDDTKDFIWFYLKGKMVDYVINTDTLEKVEGSTIPTSFVEFWKFVRKDDDHFVLAKILQQNEWNSILTQDKL